ncbi:hypothetical protein BD311DRAFT_468518 [Dichomitus squalens]|uniref:Uncharacterized protein n=1 Tax=Dichomitus squalens TaxID=114155 RepID=A0A4Q9MGN0_9APHY|nr:hypothetical protein BD311DRAFT_468518 [Dichomitus squalens]
MMLPRRTAEAKVHESCIPSAPRASVPFWPDPGLATIAVDLEMDEEWSEDRTRPSLFALIIPTSTFRNLLARHYEPNKAQGLAQVVQWADWAPGGALLLNISAQKFLPVRVIASPFGSRCVLLKFEEGSRATAEAEVLIYDLNPLARPGPGAYKPSDKVTSRVLDSTALNTADETIRTLLCTACMPYTVYRGLRVSGAKDWDQYPAVVAADTSGFTIMVCYRFLQVLRTRWSADLNRWEFAQQQDGSDDLDPEILGIESYFIPCD